MQKLLPTVFLLLFPVILFAAAPKMPDSYPGSFSIAPDGLTLAVGYYDGTIALFDTVTGNLKTSIKSGKAKIVSLEFSPDGKWLAAGDDSGSLHLVDLTTLKKKHKLKVSGSKSVYLMAFSPDSLKLAAAVDDDVALLVFDIASGKTLSSFSRMSGAEDKYAREKNDFRLLTGGYDQIAWSGERSLYTWRRMTRYLRKFSPNGQPAQEWHIEGYYELMYIPAKDRVMAFGLISPSRNQEIQMLSPADLSPVGDIKPLGLETDSDPQKPLVSPDGRFILVIQKSPEVILHIYSAEPFSIKASLKISGRAVKTNSDGSQILWYDSNKKSLILMDWATQTVIKEIPVHT